MSCKVEKLNVEGTPSGVNIDVDDAPEGIHIEYRILPDVLAAICAETLGRATAGNVGPTAQMISPIEGVRMYRYTTDDDSERVAIHLPPGVSVIDLSLAETMHTVDELTQLVGKLSG
ncbi:hypothetical protein G7Y31_06870 [Corynebacterium lizhenjunii]|uniref:Uncharacterized protein n=1 Tax=Corynebacterium lizhenjunii TaxID=2709394 RepID=A0A7T0KCL8_9CORY|nr:hypothetical protein [Corynebacterium lizhenjunii]QPK78306.1 hypothetical protein G7Y31_06870 [Corynebacterium lizhenjunii]